MTLRHKIIVVFVLIATAGGGTYWLTGYSGEAVPRPRPVDPEGALVELRTGNSRFVTCRRTVSTDTRHDADLRHATAKGQHPFATILCCSDSRICPEFIFDQQPGSLFEVRNAGNVVDDDVLGSLEYAVEHLHVSLVVVMGHKGCGAIKAVVEAGDTPLHDHLGILQTRMSGIHKQVLESNHRLDAEVVDRLVEENARQQALAVVRDSPALRTAIKSGGVRLMYGIYDMETGVVKFFNFDSSS
ncbi:MAG: carbonic anhydrase [Planctomycetes bacterium]|nr:carbonic anhydrase [Planctomycetota bacterium]